MKTEFSEDVNCYYDLNQRSIMIKLCSLNLLTENFFLTGGTALSVFYLHHRKSNDLDLFTIKDIDLYDLESMIHNSFNEFIVLKRSNTFLSGLIENTKVDFVIDKLSNLEMREKYFFGKNNPFEIDTLNNIVSNKLSAMISRTEPKDFIDFYFLFKTGNFQLNEIYDAVVRKDAIFDDAPTAAFYIEENFKKVQNLKDVFPEMIIDIDFNDFEIFYKKLISDIYNKDI